MNTDQLRQLIRELIKTELEEINSLGARGSGASFSAGDSGAYATPFAFKKKRKKRK